MFLELYHYGNDSLWIRAQVFSVIESSTGGRNCTSPIVIYNGHVYVALYPGYSH